MLRQFIARTRETSVVCSSELHPSQKSQRTAASATTAGLSAGMKHSW